MTDHPRFAKAFATEPLLKELASKVADFATSERFWRAAQDDPERAERVLRDALGQVADSMYDGGLLERRLSPDRLDALARELVATVRGDLPLGQVQNRANN